MPAQFSAADFRGQHCRWTRPRGLPGAVDARGTPERVGQAHVPDQLTELKRDPRSPAAPSGFPTPERSKSSAVPTKHGLGPDDSQCVCNARNEAIQPSQHQSVESAENKSLPGFAPQYIGRSVGGLPQRMASGNVRHANAVRDRRRSAPREGEPLACVVVGCKRLT